MYTDHCQVLSRTVSKSKSRLTFGGNVTPHRCLRPPTSLTSPLRAPCRPLGSPSDLPSPSLANSPPLPLPPLLSSPSRAPCWTPDPSSPSPSSSHHLGPPPLLLLPCTCRVGHSDLPRTPPLPLLCCLAAPDFPPR